MELKPATKNYKTELLDASSLSIVSEALLRKELVAFPTETVYGLGALAFCEESVKKIFYTKGRPQNNPLIVHVSNENMLYSVAEAIPDLFFRLKKWFWPGPLTCILSKHPDLPFCVSGGLDTVAVRMPAHPIALALIELVGEPLVAPSANLSGRPSATTAYHVLEDFDGKIPYVLDGGACAFGIESTVISLVNECPMLLRPGAIARSTLEEALGCELSLPKKGERPLSPGMLYKHYAPKARVVLCLSEEEKMAHTRTHAHRLILSSQPFEGEKLLAPQTLYSELRLADQMHCEEVLIFCDKNAQKDLALMDRVFRASCGE